MVIRSRYATGCSPTCCWRVLCLTILMLLLLASAGNAQPPHIHGASRKIRMYIKNAYLQISPNASVSSSQDDTNPHTILQRTSVAMGKVKIQAIHSCLYLCMDTCGMPYASKEYWDECIFNEVMESNLYNTYSSGKYSNARRTLYLGLNRLGEPRRVQIRGGSLGKLAAYTRVLTQAVTPRQAAGARCRGSGPPGSRETGKCLRRHGGQGPRGPVGPHGRPRQRRKRKRCREGEPCPPRRRRPLPPPHPRRHRKHRAPPTLAPEDDPEDDSFEEDDLPELFMDDNE